jgi:imidazolonepropionase-like amidohydrolase
MPFNKLSIRSICYVVLITILIGIDAFQIMAQRKLVHCGQLIDGKSDTPQKMVTLVITGNKITAIEKGFTSPQANDTVIDLRKMTVLPGLMDMHVHLLNNPSPQSYLERFTINREEYAYRSVKYAKQTLMAGFTTVRDLGGEQVVSMKRAINEGYVDGPRIIAAGKSIAVTGGHADPSNGYRKDLMGDPGPADGVINGPDDARKAVRQRYKEGSDVIKITATGGVLSVARDGYRPQFTVEEITAIVQTANDLGLTTAAHAHGAEGMKRAVLAGITSIEHGTEMTEEVMELMKARGTYYVPTISAGKYVAEKAEVQGFYPPLVADKARVIGPKIHSTFGKAYRAGVKIAFGTDAGVFPHGENAKEFIYMVEAGMPPMKAIQAATLEAAKLIRMDDQLGTLEAGKLADIIAVKENPLENIKVLTDVSFVMKDGTIYKSVE